MSTEIAILKQENIGAIVQSAPKAFDDNQLSHDRCIDYGKNILAAVEAGGMTDDLDKQAAQYIEKARRTVKAMNERRSPVTKLFNEIRDQYTRLENEVDPAKSGTVPYLLQQHRNQYAAVKRAEEEKRQREAMERQRAEEARKRYSADMEADMSRKYQAYLNNTLETLAKVYEDVTLDSYNKSVKAIEDTPDALPSGFAEIVKFYVGPMIYGLSIEDADHIESDLLAKLMPVWEENYTNAVSTNKNYYLDRMPSRKRELERIAQANAEEAARLKAEMERRQAEEAARKESERLAKEEEARRQEELVKQQAQVQSLFEAQATQQDYAPKTKVTKRIQLLDPEGILLVVSMWWANEGKSLSIEELMKTFKKQVTCCEKIANKTGETINDPRVTYIDEVKAK